MRQKPKDFVFFFMFKSTFMTNFGQESAFLTNAEKIIGEVTPQPPTPHPQPLRTALIVLFTLQCEYSFRMDKKL